MDTNGFMPPLYLHRNVAQMRQATEISNVPVCAAAGKIFDVFGDGLHGLGAGVLKRRLCTNSFLRNPQKLSMGALS